MSDSANILIINGVNLAHLGTREIDIYGSISFDAYLETLKKDNPDTNIEFFQSDSEGDTASKIANAAGLDAIILNAGAYTHTSVVIADAIRTTSVPVIEVHISNLFGRENYRKNNAISQACAGFISGFGLDGYYLAVKSVVLKKKKRNVKLFKI